MLHPLAPSAMTIAVTRSRRRWLRLRRRRAGRGGGGLTASHTRTRNDRGIPARIIAARGLPGAAQARNPTTKRTQESMKPEGINSKFKVRRIKKGCIAESMWAKERRRKFSGHASLCPPLVSYMLLAGKRGYNWRTIGIRHSVRGILRLRIMRTAPANRTGSSRATDHGGGVLHWPSSTRAADL